MGLSQFFFEKNENVNIFIKMKRIAAKCVVLVEDPNLFTSWMSSNCLALSLHCY